jgi:ABC-2 type transport system ATP-binding protein
MTADVTPTRGSEPGTEAPDRREAGGSPPVVELERVSVRYGRTAALLDVSASFPAGAVGLLGPNGAGKTTLIKALLGFLTPERGALRVLGRDVRGAGVALRARIGYMPEIDGHVPGMNAVSFVGYCGELAGLPRADAMQRAHEVLYYVGLGEARYRNVDTYSTGMKQRIKLAQALVHDPDLLFLDEPTNGMDPKGRDEMLALIRDIAHHKGLSLILSSHLLPDVEHTCDHVVVLDRGMVAAQGPIAGLKGHGGQVFELRVKGDVERFVGVLRAHGLECHGTDESVMRVFVLDARGPQFLFQLAAAHRVQVRHLRSSVPTLEDVFAKAVGESLGILDS